MLAFYRELDELLDEDREEELLEEERELREEDNELLLLLERLLELLATRLGKAVAVLKTGPLSEGRPKMPR